MIITLLKHTPNPERLVAAAAKVCYSPDSGKKVFENLTNEESLKFLNRLMEMGHESPLEHTVFSFAVDGVSRALTHQLVRHRVASYSQKSQRYVQEIGFEYVTPPIIQNDEVIKENYDRAMKNCMFNYDVMVRRLLGEGRTKEQACEDARYILPNACCTNIIVTMNARELLHFFKVRCCNRAQWEIRELADKMLEECRKVAPVLFENAGPDCTKDRGCSEGVMRCGEPREGS